MSYKTQDTYFKKAKKEGYLARSAYKLDEIQKRCHILRKGDRVLDLGCAPGAWSQIALKIVGANGFVEGVDLKEVGLSAPNAKFRVKDAFELTPEDFESKLFDVVVSDMAPNTTGHIGTDQARSEALCEQVIHLSDSLLKPKGHIVMKLFMGPGEKDIEAQLKQRFEKIRRIRPDSTRKVSKEIFIVGLNKKA